MKKALYLFFVTFLYTSIVFSQDYDSNIPSFSQIAGYNIGDKPAKYFDVVNYITAVANSSERVVLVKEGKTYQGRDLYYLIVTSPRNHNNIDKIKKNLSLLADPRMERTKSREEIINTTPGVVFMMYSIHGNEASGTNASLKLLYELSASKDELIKDILEKLIIIIYPMENPDGRERFISEAEQWYGAVTDPDVQSYPHSGLWPSGRTNHYHFDLNRDWFILSQPESKARVKAILEWKPLLVIDAHEMGPFSTFLFNPPREPINPHLHRTIQNWWKVFTKDQAAAFDKQGWSYYTREWLEEWYPGYGSSWPSYAGAVSILYEQARTAGTDVKRPDGTILTYAESVEHQFVSSLANIKTAYKNKNALLKDYYEMKKEAVANNEKIKAYIITPDKNKTRLKRFVSRLLFQNIELYYSEESFEVDEAKNIWGEIKNKFDKGSLIIPLNQPLSPLVKAICDFDTRMSTEFLKSERESILKGKGTRLYEVSAWSMPLAYGLDIYQSEELPEVSLKQVSDVAQPEGKLINPDANYGYVIPIDDENVYPMLNVLLNAGLNINVADKPFEVEGIKFDRGSLLIRKIENPKLDIDLLKSSSNEYGINIYGVNTALAVNGTDLGGGNFTLLTTPHSALIVGRKVSMNAFGSLWYLFDRELKMRVSKIDIQRIGSIDLSKYNILILPSYYGSFKNDLGANGLSKLKEWTSNGGTLIAIGNAAAALADTSAKFSKVKLRRQILSKLDSYYKAKEEEENAFKVTVDSIDVWEPADFEIPVSNNTKADIKALSEFDKKARKLSPQGVFLNVKVNSEHWLNYGMPERVAAFHSSSNVFMSKYPVETAARFSEYKGLRLSGLLWKEARKRIASSSYLTREKYGEGQIIMFADHPNFRAYNYGTNRMLLNAVFFGPGHGTRRKVDW